MATMSGSKAGEQALPLCLRQTDALSMELAAAISAIAENRAAAFEASLRRQQELGSSLLAALSQAKPAVLWEHLQFRDAMRKLFQVNEQYAALIEHASRSTRMLQALHAGQFGRRKDRGTPTGLERLPRQTAQGHSWSWQG